MQPILADLLHLLELERLEDNIFRGESRDIGSPRVFGGQVLGQALTAASYTVDGRDVHSLHAYFLRPGDVNAHIVYEVDRARDGRSYSSRRVVAIQHGRPILNLAASFQTPERGIEHQCEMPDVPGPEGLADISEIPRQVIEAVPEKMRRFLTKKRPFEIRPVEPIHLLSPKPAAARAAHLAAQRSTLCRTTRICTAICSLTSRIISSSRLLRCRTAFTSSTATCRWRV